MAGLAPSLAPSLALSCSMAFNPAADVPSGSPVSGMGISGQMVSVEPLAQEAMPTIVQCARQADVILVGEGSHLSGKGREFLSGVVQETGASAFVIEGYGPEHEERLNDPEELKKMTSSKEFRFSYDYDGAYSGGELLQDVNEAGIRIYGGDDMALHTRAQQHMDNMDQQHQENLRAINHALDGMESKELPEKIGPLPDKCDPSPTRITSACRAH